MMGGKILALKQVRVKVIGQLEQRKVKLRRGRVQRVLPLHTTPAELTALSIKTLMPSHKFVYITDMHIDISAFSPADGATILHMVSLSTTFWRNHFPILELKP